MEGGKNKFLVHKEERRCVGEGKYGRRGRERSVVDKILEMREEGRKVGV